ncbi:hypothetical protein LOK49_LG07G00254 [Camellia lanceoleosa]|uniref:Uncharacterized protein n=1 Tax=Camellia lanceoleosa TaxID=1840588 RepID=A0ACC0H146_9ERIC|nr:hypothetical protein LOK49_LG07G00254 [Camellia lanceoleosa]
MPTFFYPIYDILKHFGVELGCVLRLSQGFQPKGSLLFGPFPLSIWWENTHGQHTSTSTNTWLIQICSSPYR